MKIGQVDIGVPVHLKSQQSKTKTMTPLIANSPAGVSAGKDLFSIPQIQGQSSVTIFRNAVVLNFLWVRILALYIFAHSLEIGWFWWMKGAENHLSNFVRLV